MKFTIKTSHLFVSLIAIATLNFLLLCFFVILSLAKKDVTILNYISISSSFTVAILTIMYVYSSTRQMDIMQLQLKEMEKEHLLKEHPILLLDNTEFTIEVPRFFYSPPSDQFSFFSRFYFNATLINTCNDPAITIRLVTNIKIPNDPAPLTLRSFVEKYNFSSSNYKSQNAHFMFVEDKNGELFNALRENKEISIETVIYYQNTSGACFKLSNAYSFTLSSIIRAYSKRKTEESCSSESNVRDIIKNWHTSIVQAPAMYKEKVAALRRIAEETGKRSEFNQSFDLVKEAFSSQLIEKTDIQFVVFEDNDRFEFKSITKEEFAECPDNKVLFEELVSRSKQLKN